MKESIKSEGKETIKDIIISIFIVAVIFLALFAYSGVWPPIVVVESGSMQHGKDSSIGTIDTGDIVVVKKVYSPDDIKTYIEGRMTGYQTYGNYGDVIIYHYNGMSIIHRAIAYLMWDGHEWKIRGVNESNLPNWLYIDRTPGQEMLTIYNVTLSNSDKKYMIMIHLDPEHLNPKVVGDQGFITMGDHNMIEFGPTAYDQNGADGYTPICPKLVNYSMITGVARGELPWFGAIKLYFTGTNTNEIPPNTNMWLGISIVTLVAASFLIDYALDHRKELWEKFKTIIKRDEEEQDDEDSPE